MNKEMKTFETLEEREVIKILNKLYDIMISDDRPLINKMIPIILYHITHNDKKIRLPEITDRYYTEFLYNEEDFINNILHDDKYDLDLMIDYFRYITEIFEYERD